MHELHSGDILGGWLFHLHLFLPSRYLPGGWFFRVQTVSCGDKLCIGEC